MSPSSNNQTSSHGPSSPNPSSAHDANPPTVAAFSPNTLSGSSSIHKQRSTIIVHKKSPLLVATPPQITRALAYSHPFLLPLNKLAGLLSWSSGDPWESFLLVSAFWSVCMYGSEIVLWAGPILVVVGLILGMYSRRYSPLSSTSQTGEKHGQKGESSEGSSRQHKSLDEIVETLHNFTARCNLLLDPFLRLTDFLSTQRTPTSATTRPALTALFIRILLVTPVWILLTLPPLRLITTRRVVLSFGTIILTWHSRPARVSRVILWRSLTVRRICGYLTGLSFSDEPDSAPSSDNRLRATPTRSRSKSQTNIASDIATKRRPDSSGVRFTFILYENQRRWLGIGWTYSLLAYERAPWTDEHLNSAPPKDEFELPDVESPNSRWRWVEGSMWRIEGGTHNKPSPSVKGSTAGTKAADAKEDDGGGWIYYDNKWNDGRRGVDSWGRYTRRRKWYRDAELVEVTPSTEVTPSPTPNPQNTASRTDQQPILSEAEEEEGMARRSVDGAPPEDDAYEEKPQQQQQVKKGGGWFGGGGGGGGPKKDKEKKDRERRESKSSGSGKSGGAGTTNSRESAASSVRTDPGEDHLDRWKDGGREGRGDWGLGEDAAMGLS
ncbi:MAG: hypothetical protein Q9227_002858 [Pyrenula ochraceoflavens]